MMKKILLASTALMFGAASQATTANASEPLTGSVGGYMNVGVSFKDGEDGMGVMRDGEIFLKFKGTSDNGLTFDGRVELEAFTSDAACADSSTDFDFYNVQNDECSNGDQIDENWARVSGSFGSIKIGADDSAKNAYANGVIYAPAAIIGYYDGWGFLGNVQPGISGSGDYIGVHYDSPDFSGFRFGATYQPNRQSDGAGGGVYNDPIFTNTGTCQGDTNAPVYNCNADGDNFWAVGAVYEGDFNGFGVGISAGYADSDGSDMETWHVGGNVSTSGFTVAVHYEDNGGPATNTDLAIGASYATGPWTIAGGWSQNDTSGNDPQVFSGWVTYAVAPGVKATVGFEYGDPDNGTDEVLGGMAYLNLSF
jgi:predicted porin